MLASKHVVQNTNGLFQRSIGAGCRYLSGEALPDELRLAFAYCVKQVRTYDYENYVWCSQLDKAMRPPIFALRAYNVETALVAERTQKGGAMLRQMRFKWWEDAVGAIYKGVVPDHPVTKALAYVVENRHLTRYRVKKIAQVRGQDAVGVEVPKNVAALELYADGTAGQLMLLQMEAVGIKEGAACEAAQLIGRSVGVASLLRGTIHHAQQGRIYLPLDLCDQYDVPLESLLAGQVSDGVKKIAKEVADVAMNNISEARKLSKDIPPGAKPLLLPATIVDMQLSALKRRGYNVFDPSWMSRGVLPLWLQLRLKLNMMTGQF